MSTTVIRASSQSPFIWARAGFTALRLDETGAIWADSSSHPPRLLTHRANIRRLGWAREDDGEVFSRHCGPEGAVWIETDGEVLVFPLDEWWPGHSVDHHERMLASSGFAALFRQLGKTPHLWRELKQPPSSEPSDALLVSTSIDRNRVRLAQLQVLTALAAGLTFALSLGFSIAAGFAEALRPLTNQLGIITSIGCAFLSFVALAPALAWARWPPGPGRPSSSNAMTVSTDRGPVTLTHHGRQLVIHDAIGTRTTFDLASPTDEVAHLSSLATWGVTEDASIVALDGTRQPRVRLLPARRTPLDHRRLGAVLTASGLRRTELTEDDVMRSRDLLPVGGSSAGRQALRGAGPWRTPSLLTALVPAFFIGTIALPLAVGLVDSLDADPIWAVLAVASTALFICTHVVIAAWALWQDRRR